MILMRRARIARCAACSAIRPQPSRRIFFALIVAAWLLLQPSEPTPASAQAPMAALALGASYVKDEVVVKLKPDTPPESLRLYAPGAYVRAGATAALSALGVTILKVPEGTVPQAVADLRRSPAVEFAEPNYLVHAAVITPSDPGWANQYGPVRIQAPQAWEITTGSISVTIAVIDSGVDFSHPDLASKIWTNPGETSGGKKTNGIDDDGDGYVDDWRGWDFVNGDNNPQDDYGHGTHVSGIAAAASDNGIGIAGIAWGAQIMPLKVLDNTGNGADSDVATALIFAANHGAQIINLSLGGDAPAAVMEAAVNYAYGHGATIVAAAGNTGTQGVLYPAAYLNAIAVAATNPDNSRAWFSSYGPQVDLAAPGVGIYSTYWTATSGSTYFSLSGTSMATPHVAGVAALLASLPQFNTPDKIRAALEGTALDLGPVCRDPYYGFGLVQAFDALQFDPNLPVPVKCYYYFAPIIGKS
jgi:thermitase